VTFDAELKLLLANPVEELLALRQAEIIPKVPHLESVSLACIQRSCLVVLKCARLCIVTDYAWTVVDEHTAHSLGRAEWATCI
jgi:hypothetical protein